MRRREKGCIFWSGFIKAQFKVPFLQICHFKVMNLSSWRVYIVKNGGDSCPEKSGMGIWDFGPLWKQIREREDIIWRF